MDDCAYTQRTGLDLLAKYQSVMKYLQENHSSQFSGVSPLDFLDAQPQEKMLKSGHSCLIYTWRDMVGLVVCDDKLGRVLKSRIILTPQTEFDDVDSTHFPLFWRFEELGALIKTSWEKTNTEKHVFRGRTIQMTGNPLTQNDGWKLLECIYRDPTVSNAGVHLAEGSLSLFVAFSQADTNTWPCLYLTRVDGVLNDGETYKAPIVKAPFLSEFRFVDYDPENVAMVVFDNRKVCSDYLFKVYLVPVKGPLDFKEHLVTLDMLPRDSGLVRCILAEDMKTPDVRTLNGMIFCLVGLTYVSVVDLSDLSHLKILSFELILGATLDGRLRVAGCGDVRAVYAPGMNQIAFVNRNRTVEIAGFGISLGDGLQNLIELDGDGVGIRCLADLGINRSACLIRVEDKNGNDLENDERKNKMLYIAEGGKGVTSDDKEVKEDLNVSEELRRLRRCSIFAFELDAKTLNVPETQNLRMRYLNDWNADPRYIASVGGYLVMSAAHSTAPSKHYLTLLDKELKIVDQDKNLVLKDRESLVSFDAFNQIVSFSDQNSFLIHKIEEKRGKLILKKIVDLSLDFRSIRFSEHLNVPREFLMALIVDQGGTRHLIEVNHSEYAMNSLDLIEPRTHMFVKVPGAIIVDQLHLFLGVEVEEPGPYGGKLTF